MVKYYKTFFMLNEEDRGFKEGNSPSGYVKIEAREGKGRLDCHVSNLKSENLKYKLYIMKVDEENVVYFSPGYINFKGREGELIKYFDPSNVGGTGISIEHFNAAALLLDSSYDSIICPLAGYKDKKKEWRSKLKRSLNAKAIPQNKNFTENSATRTKKDESITNNIVDNIIANNKVATDNKETNKDTGIKYGKGDSDKDNNKGGNNKDNNKGNIKNDIKDTGIKYTGRGNEYGSENKTGNSNGNKEESIIGNTGNTGISEKGIKFEEEKNDKNTNPKNSEEEKNLEGYFDKFFKKIKPFRVERKDYKWWQILNPADLNNILYKFNIKVPLLFNPLVMMSYFKYKHMIVGLYEDRKKKLKYIVCGIPGLYWVDENPFGEVCRWAQVEGDKPRYGAFGYWLIYINPATGRILSNN